MKTSILTTAIFLLAATATLAQTKLQPVYSDNTYQFTGVAVSAKGRLFVTYPRWSDTYNTA
jgi:hypothetical protein